MLPVLATNALEDHRLVTGLFLSTCLLSIVSWYTTWQGMALYLNGWFAFLASLGVQSALVLVAWLVGQARTGRALLVGVYAITAIVSIAFSYASLHTWFAAKERPALVQRGLYDTLQDAAGKAEQLLAAAEAEQQKHVLALEALTASEKTQGHASLGQDSDPYLAKTREAIAQEARSLGSGFKEAAGAGVRHAAFERHTGIARRELEQLQASRKALAAFKTNLKPLEASEQQIRAYREVFDAIPWSLAEGALHAAKFERPAVPTLAEHLDRTSSGQEDLLLAFQELVTAPTSRHLLAFLLAAFIDLIVFLVASASAPHLAGPPERRWVAAGAALDGTDAQLFVRGLLRKLEADGRGLARLSDASLTAGERALCLLLCAHKRAQLDGGGAFLLDEALHETLVEGLAVPNLALRIASAEASH